jgi:hypothetical protein
VKGRLFDKDNQFKAYIARLEKNKSGCYQPDQVPDEVLNQACELIIDNRSGPGGKVQHRRQGPVPRAGFFHLRDHRSRGADGLCPLAGGASHLQPGDAVATLYFVKLDPNVVATEDRESDQGKIPIQVCMEAVAKATRLRSRPCGNTTRCCSTLSSDLRVYQYCQRTDSDRVVPVHYGHYLHYGPRAAAGDWNPAVHGGHGDIYHESDDRRSLDHLGMRHGCGAAMAFGAKEAIEHFKPLLTVDLQTRWVLLGDSSVSRADSSARCIPDFAPSGRILWQHWGMNE